MTTVYSLETRPPIGFVVEGQGEFNAYPSLVARITGALGVHFPCVNAGGYGNIVRHVDEYVDRLVRYKHPFHVIVTVDLRDVIRDGLFSSCRELRSELVNKIQRWQQLSEQKDCLQPLPECITVVVQVQMLESWVIADVSSLQKVGYAKPDVTQPLDVDGTIDNPETWLGRHVSRYTSLKDPTKAKEIMGLLDPHSMRKHSHSFDKFYRTVQAAYWRWCDQCGLEA